MDAIVFDRWLCADTVKVLALQPPLPDDALRIVASGEKKTASPHLCCAKDRKTRAMDETGRTIGHCLGKAGSLEMIHADKLELWVFEAWVLYKFF